MLIKIILCGLLIFMIYNLFLAMKVMMNHDPDGEPMSKFIGRRVLTSVVIVIIILIALATGLITPNARPY
jgi:low temperature requirement protein LtrA